MAIFVSTSSSPSAAQSTKYVVLGMNFFQGIGAIKLINIEWPSIVMQMFDIMQYFSFSLSAVRPECAFSWSFELKVSLTLLLPILLSFLLCFALYAYYGEIGGEKCAFFGEKAVADGWPKDLAPRIIVGVLRIFILYAFVAGIVVLFLYACVQFFFYFIKFIEHCHFVKILIWH
jgi:hypothetical protein